MRTLLDRPPNYDHDYDGRPPVGWHDDDPLLAPLIRSHPEHMPADFITGLNPRGGAEMVCSRLAGGDHS